MPVHKYHLVNGIFDLSSVMEGYEYAETICFGIPKAKNNLLA